VAELDAARAAVGEAWFAGGATLAEAIERKCRALEGDAAKSESTCDFMVGLVDSTSTAAAVEKMLELQIASAEATKQAVAKTVLTCFTPRELPCSCGRRCGATVPCEIAISGEGCAGRCFCGVDDEEGSDG